MFFVFSYYCNKKGNETLFCNCIFSAFLLLIQCLSLPLWKCVECFSLMIRNRALPSSQHCLKFSWNIRNVLLPFEPLNGKVLPVPLSKNESQSVWSEAIILARLGQILWLWNNIGFFQVETILPKLYGRRVLHIDVSVYLIGIPAVHIILLNWDRASTNSIWVFMIIE